MNNKKYKINACGLCCDICEAKTTKVQEAATKVLKTLEDPAYRAILAMGNPQCSENNFSIAQHTLEAIGTSPPCPGCEKREECSIKTCTKQHSVKNCGECSQFDTKIGTCTAPPTPPAMPFLPPTPVFFQGLSQRYRNWNVDNLRLLKEGKLAEVNMRITQLRAKKKTARDLIDTSVNLFQLKPPPGK